MNIDLNYLPWPTRSVLEKVAQRKFIMPFYLAGGTAVALYLNHRRSDDLDFFSEKPFRTTALIQRVKELGRFEGFESAKDTLLGTVDGVKISFFALPYGLLEKPVRYGNARIAGLIDLALMKILALSDRSTKRDFVDLYLLCQNVKPLDELLHLFQKKYGTFDFNIYHIIQSFTYFKEADSDEMPHMRIPLEWEEVKVFFEKEKPKLAKKFLAIS